MSKIISTIKVPVATVVTGGVLKDFLWNWIVRGYEVSFTEQVTTLVGRDVDVQPDFSTLVAIITNGGTFEGVKLAIEFATAGAASQLVPTVVRNSTYTDEEGLEVNRTWLEWLTANTNNTIIKEIAGTKYVTKASFAGQLLNSTELAAIHQQAGITVIEWTDAVARFSSEDYELFEL